MSKSVEFQDPENMIRGYQDGSCDSGGSVERAFCSNCGSNVRIKNPENPQIAGFTVIPIGIVDGDKSRLVPGHEFFTKSRVNWYMGVEGSSQHQSMT